MPQFNRSASLFVRTTDNIGVNITGLRIVANVTKTDDKTPNTASIEIYNMSDNTFNKIKKDGDIVILNAGYLDGDGEEVIFIGNIKTTNRSPNKPDSIVTLSAQDGKNALDSAKVSINQTGGVSASAILKQILNSFPIGNNLSTANIPIKKYQSGFVYVGASKKALDKVTKFLDLSWSIQDNEINIIPFDQNNGSKAVSLSSTTGLIGFPQRIDGTTRKDAGKSTTEKPGWRVTSLLSPKLVPQGKLELQSREIPIRSFFNIKTVEHTLDTHGKSWVSVVEVTE